MKHPAWWPRAEELKEKGLEDAEIVTMLNGEGYLSKQGKRLNTDMVRCYRRNRKLRRQLKAYG